MAVSKFKITDWIKYQSISPLNWGDSINELIILFKNSQKALDYSIKTKTPFISLDFVEFYFKDDVNYKDLTDIIIKCNQIYKGRRMAYFDNDWLRNNLKYQESFRKLSKLEVDFKIHYSKYNPGIPYLITSAGQSFVFEDDLTLQKIYIKK